MRLRVPVWTVFVQGFALNCVARARGNALSNMEHMGHADVSLNSSTHRVRVRGHARVSVSL